jgi:hypothetical protein
LERFAFDAHLLGDSKRTEIMCLFLALHSLPGGMFECPLSALLITFHIRLSVRNEAARARSGCGIRRVSDMIRPFPDIGQRDHMRCFSPSCIVIQG